MHAAQPSPDALQGLDRRPLPDLALLLSHELRMLHASMQLLQDDLGSIAARRSGAASCCPAFQEVDRVTQTLDQLSLFLANMADALPNGVCADIGRATAQISLGVLRARLDGGPPDTVADDRGSVELF